MFRAINILSLICLPNGFIIISSPSFHFVFLQLLYTPEDRNVMVERAASLDLKESTDATSDFLPEIIAKKNTQTQLHLYITVRSNGVIIYTRGVNNVRVKLKSHFFSDHMNTKDFARNL